MPDNLNPAMVLDGINAGLAMQRKPTAIGPATPNAQMWFATGSARTTIEAGNEIQKSFTEHDRRVIKAFAARLYNFDSPGAILTMPKGREVRLVSGIGNRAFKATGNLLIAQAFADGYNNRIKLAPGISLVGGELLTHLEDGAIKFQLMEPLEPLVVAEAVISLFYADMWQPKSD